MTKITEFPLKTTKDKWGQGEAFCLACKYEWQAVAPVGTLDLECPECGSDRGQFKHPFDVEEGATIWECGCGSTYFQLVKEDYGHDLMCVGCGIRQRF